MNAKKIMKQLDELGIKFKRVYPNTLIKLEDGSKITWHKLKKQLPEKPVKKRATKKVAKKKATKKATKKQLEVTEVFSQEISGSDII